MIMLFEDIERTFLGPSNHNENPFSYYDRSARKDIKIIRDKLNDWFLDYPDNEKKELKNRFINHFDDSFFELFLFQLFRKLGFQVCIHPAVPNSTKRPDFLIKKESLEIYIEAKLVKAKSKEQEALERKINEFYDNISKIKVPGFLLCIDTLLIKTRPQPTTKKIIKYFEDEIKKIDPIKLNKELELDENPKLPLITYENDDILIVVKPMPIMPTVKEEDDHRPIGMYPIESFCGNGIELLKDAVEKKAKRYGRLDKPFIVCTNITDIKTSGIFDIENAVWGSLAISWSSNPNNRDKKLIRQLDGLFLDKKGPRLKNLSGVFFTRIFPHNIPEAKYWLFEHPFSENTLDFKKVGLDYNYVHKGKIYSSEGQNLDIIMQIPKNWLSIIEV